MRFRIRITIKRGVVFVNVFFAGTEDEAEDEKKKNYNFFPKKAKILKENVYLIVRGIYS